jgi:hypothetical protein
MRRERVKAYAISVPNIYTTRWHAKGADL